MNRKSLIPRNSNCIGPCERKKDKFRKRLQGFKFELEKTGVSSSVTQDILGKLNTVYKRSISKDFKFDEMSKCKDMTDKLDRIRKEKFKDVFGYEISAITKQSGTKILL